MPTTRTEKGDLLVDDTPPPDPHGDDLAALDFFAPATESGSSDLDALGDYGVVDHSVRVDDGQQEDVGSPASSFAVTNPPGTVTVSTLADGRVDRVELSPKATAMTETELADEIVVIARLATQDARAAQYALMLESMREHGHDEYSTRDFLTRDLDLPSPDDAIADRAHIFTTRYAGEE